MKSLASLSLSVSLALALAVVGCKKAAEESKSQPQTETQTQSQPAQKPIPPPPARKNAGAQNADHLLVHAKHVDPTEPDVDVAFPTWTVTKAAFDPANLEGGTAEIEIDVASLSSGIAKRDAHLNKPDYLDTAAFPKATVKIENVKKTGEQTYTADATVKIHGVEKTWSLPFEVVSRTADSVRVKFTQPFSRLDFNVGKPETEDSSQAQMELQGLLTIKKT
jgi:polyisoprenoid-binding protein YceI